MSHQTQQRERFRTPFQWTSQVEWRQKCTPHTPHSNAHSTITVVCSPTDDVDVDVAEEKQMEQEQEKKQLQQYHHHAWNLSISADSLTSSLNPKQLLNEDVMNFYLALLQDRNNRRCLQTQTSAQCCRVLLMSTHFYTRLTYTGYKYANVLRWTRKEKLHDKGLNDIETIFDVDKLIFPVHLNNNHWTVGCVNFKESKIEYYDSFNSRGNHFFGVMHKYLRDESRDKLNQDFTCNGWDMDDHLDKQPQQTKGYDCGVFALKCIECVGDDLHPRYTSNTTKQLNMFRKQMKDAIVCGQILNDLKKT